MSIRLYVGNLPKEVDKQELAAVFADAGDSVTTKLITDRKTGKCRGFGFVTVKNDQEADQIIEKYNGYLFKESPLKIEKALPRSKGKGNEEEAAPSTPASGATAVASSGGRRNKGNNKSRRPSTPVPSEPGAIQPDPRWAQDLEKLKQMLAAQATNS